MPRYSLAGVALMATSAYAAQSIYGQCGGTGYSGETSCAEGSFCTAWNPYYYQCIPGTATASVATSETCTSASVPATVTVTKTSTFTAYPVSKASSVVVSVAPSSAKVSSLVVSTPTPAKYTTLVVSSKAPVSSAKVSSTPAVVSSKTPVSSAKASSSVAAAVSSKVSSAAVSSTPAVSSAKASSAVVAVASSSKVSSAAAAASTSSSGKTQYAGINIAGFDFGCGTDGTCTVSGAYGAITSSNNGTAQMVHFVNDDKLNAFRLPVGWQYLVNSVLGGTLDATNFANYDELVQGCLATGSLCIIDIHNYARWNGAIIGQGGPTNDQFTNLWTQLAKKYASNSKIAFGVMNEPHDLTVSTWATTVQAVVTAIRNAGATSQYILLPGTDYTSAGSYVSSGSAEALLAVTNPDGSTDGLIFDVHRYLDSDNSGTSTECVTNNIDTSFSPLADWLRTNKRQAFLTETGGGNTASCETYVCQELAYLNENADVYMGYLGWAAGSFDSSYALTLTPNGNTDTALAAACFSRA